MPNITKSCDPCIDEQHFTKTEKQTGLFIKFSDTCIDMVDINEARAIRHANHKQRNYHYYYYYIYLIKTSYYIFCRRNEEWVSPELLPSKDSIQGYHRPYWLNCLSKQDMPDFGWID